MPTPLRLRIKTRVLFAEEIDFAETGPYELRNTGTTVFAIRQRQRA